MIRGQILEKENWGKGIIYGIIAGVIWGIISLTVNSVSGVFSLEETIIRNLMTFSIGGAFFGVVTSGLLMVMRDWLPFERITPKAILVSTGLWSLLRITGFLLSSVDPNRYHAVALQTFQGFLLAILLGGLLGTLWKIKER